MQEPLPQIQPYHLDVEVQRWSVQIDYIHMVLVILSKYAGLSIVDKMKVNLNRHLRLRYPELKRMYLGAVLWSPRFFSSTVGLDGGGDPAVRGSSRTSGQRADST